MLNIEVIASEKNDETEASEEVDFIRNLDSKSVEVLEDCMIEPALSKAISGERYQFLRKGYFCLDKDSTKDKLVFNQIVSLRDSWSKILIKTNQKS